MTIFEEVKDLVDVPTAARHYGLEINKSNMAVCPFHNERTPSCKLYEKNYYCFGCQDHGDVIRLVQELFGLTPIEAVRQLNNDFSLGLDVDKPPDQADIQRIEKKKEELRAYEEWENHAYQVLNDYLWLMRDWRLCTSYACIFPVISHKNSLKYDSIPASFLCDLTKNLTVHLPHNLCAVLP